MIFGLLQNPAPAQHAAGGEAALDCAGRVHRLGQRAEVHRDDCADECPEQQQEATLPQQIGFARLVDQLRDFAHRSVHGEVAELHVRRKAEHEAEPALKVGPSSR